MFIYVCLCYISLCIYDNQITYIRQIYNKLFVYIYIYICINGLYVSLYICGNKMYIYGILIVIINICIYTIKHTCNKVHI